MNVSSARPPLAFLPALAVLLLAPPALAATPDPGTSLDGLVSRAEVTGPRGRFITEMVSRADGTARFVQIYPPSDPKARGRIEIVIGRGNRAYQRGADGQFVAAPPGTAAFVSGHDAVRHSLTGKAARPARISLAGPAEMGGGTVTVDLADFRRVIAFDVPYSATFVHSAAPADRYLYEYAELLPFRVAPGSPAPDEAAPPAVLFDQLGEFAELARAHETVMAAHRASDAQLLTARAADRSTISGGGRLSEVTREDQRTRMQGYLASIRFSRYEDTAVPVIALSIDGTLAWLACEMQAQGVRVVEGRDEPLAYAFSWTELYARDAADAHGRRAWRAIGNASSQRP